MKPSVVEPAERRIGAMEARRRKALADVSLEKRRMPQKITVMSRLSGVCFRESG